MKRLRGRDQSFPEDRPRPNPLSVADLGGGLPSGRVGDFSRVDDWRAGGLANSQDHRLPFPAAARQTRRNADVAALSELPKGDYSGAISKTVSCATVFMGPAQARCSG